MRMKLLYISFVLLGLLIAPAINTGYSIAKLEESDQNIRGSRQIPEIENNDDFSRANLVEVSPGMTAVEFQGKFKNDQDEDYYKLFLTNGETGGLFPSEITIILKHNTLSSGKPAYMQVWDPDQHFIARTFPTEPSNPQYSLVASSQGFHYFSVHQTSTGTSGNYIISFENNTANENDNFDGNHNFTRAEYISDITTPPGSYNQSFIHFYNDTYDFYKFDALAGMQLDVNLTMYSDMDLDLYVYDSESANYVGSSANTGDGRPEEVKTDVLFDGTYYVRVITRYWPGANLSSEGNYNLSIYGSMRPVWNQTQNDSIELYEDQGVFYRGLDNLFIEYNKQLLTYELWNETLGDWDSHIETDNMTITIVDNGSNIYSLKAELKPDKFGVDQVRFRVEDPDQWTAFRLNNITVYEVNDKPVLNATETWPVSGGTIDTGTDKIKGTQNTNLNFTVSAKDIDLQNPGQFKDSLTYNASLVSQGTSQLTELPFIIDPVFGWVNFTPTNDAVGNFQVNFSVTDNPYLQDPEIDYRTVTISIANVNDKPVMDPVPTLYIDEDSWLNYTFTALDIDPTSDSLSYTVNVTSASFSGDFSFGTDGKLSFLPDNDDVGWHYLNVTVSDEGPLSDSMDVKIKVNNTNDAPVAVISSPDEGDVFVAGKELIKLDASDSFDVDQKHGDRLSYSWRSSLDFDLGTGKTMSIYLMKEGTHEITLTVKDLKEVSSTAVVNVSVVAVKPPENGEDIPIPTLNLTYPADDIILNTNKTDLRWITSYIYVSDLRYDVYLYEKDKPETEPRFKDVASMSVQAADLKDKTTYEWEVIPKYGVLEGNCFNGPWQFQIDYSFVPQYGVSAEVVEKVTIKQNETKSFVINVTNTGNIVDEYEITIETDNPGLTATFGESKIKTSVRITTGDTSTITFDLTASKTINEGEYKVSFTVTSMTDNTKFKNLETKVTVKAADDDDGKPIGPGTDGKDKKEDEQNWVWLAAVVIVVIVILMLFFLVMRQRKAKAAEAETETPPGMAQPTPPLGAPYGVPTQPLEVPSPAPAAPPVPAPVPEPAVPETEPAVPAEPAPAPVTEPEPAEAAPAPAEPPEPQPEQAAPAAEAEPAAAEPAETSAAEQDQARTAETETKPEEGQ